MSDERPLAVTVVSDATDIWGSERSVLSLAPGLLRRGIRLTVACPPGHFAAAARAAGLGHVPLLLPARGGVRSGRADLLRDALGVPAGVRRIVRACAGADVTHSNNLLLHPDAALAGRLARRPTVLELHDIVAPGAPAAVLSVAVVLSSATVSISRATGAPVRGVARRRLHDIAQALDTEHYRPGPPDAACRALLGGPADRPAPRLLVGMLGRIDPEKGLHRVIEAAARLPDVHLAVVGAPGRDTGYEQQMHALGERLLGDRVTFTGPRDDTVTVLRSLDVLVNASDAEPFGLSVLEAQACARAVVVARTGGLPDFVHHDRTGLVVDVDDAAALASALADLRDAPERRERLGRAARASVLAGHSIDGRAEAFAHLYRACADGARGRRRR